MISFQWSQSTCRSLWLLVLMSSVDSLSTGAAKSLPVLCLCQLLLLILLPSSILWKSNHKWAICSFFCRLTGLCFNLLLCLITEALSKINKKIFDFQAILNQCSWSSEEEKNVELFAFSWQEDVENEAYIRKILG